MHSQTLKKRIDNYSIMIASKYFGSIDDFINLEIAVKRFNGNMERFHFNPIPLDDETRKFFPNLETLNVYSLNDRLFTDGKIFKRCIWYKTFHFPKDKRINEICKDIRFRCDYFKEISNGNECKHVAFFDSIDDEENIPRYITEVSRKSFKAPCISLPSTLVNINNIFFETTTTSITIPNLLSVIGNKIYFGNQTLRSFQAPFSLKLLNGNHFIKQEQILNFNIPEDYQFLEDNCFGYCIYLTSITVPTTIKTLPSRCFQMCESLKQIEIPTSIMFINNDCFDNCISLKSIAIPEGIKSIPSGCFSYCKGLEQITIPSTVVSFKRFCFAYCESLGPFLIPTNVTKIGANVFKGCRKIKEKNVTANLVSLCTRGFLFSSITSLTIDNYITSNNRKILYRHQNTLGRITIPDNVKYVNGLSFLNTTLTSFEIPSSIETICENCFLKFRGLKNLTISPSVVNIGNNCFAYCVSLSHVEIPSHIQRLPVKCFYRCFSLKTIQLPLDLTSIGKSCFGRCGFEGIKIPNNVSTLPVSCFNGCIFLKHIEFPKSLKTIMYDCFEGCIKLSIDIPDDVTVHYYAISRNFRYGCAKKGELLKFDGKSFSNK